MIGRTHGSARFALFIAIAAALTLAPQCHQDNVTPAPQPPGPGPIPVEATCANACAHLGELHCVSAQPAEDGASCEQVCEDVNASGTLSIDTDCVLNSTSCAQADRCVR